MADLQSLADAPGTLREYETIYILRPDTPNERVADINGRIRGIVEKTGGKVLEVDNWGKRRLAYEVDKHLKGIYLYWQYLGSPSTVAEFERNMRLFDSVIRYMTVKLDENVDAEARPSDVDEDAYERAATTAADEEDLMVGATRGEDETEDSARAAEDEGGEGDEAGAEGGDAEGTEAEAKPADDASDDGEDKE